MLGIRRRRKPKKKKKKWDKKPVPIIPTKDPTVHVQLRGESARFGRDVVPPTVEMEDTVLRSDSEETTVIDDGDETTLLGDDSGDETTLWGEEASDSPQPFFRKDINIIVVHSHITI